MLSKLYIQNYAIIDELDISFHPEFTVITGETGAGKSIILGALSLILGERADTSVLIDKNKKCIVEAVFDLRGHNSAREWILAEDLDYDDDTRIRREISTSGKSRAFINDTPVQLAQLQQLGLMLVDLNRQFDNRLLLQSAFTFQMLDSFTENTEIIRQYRELRTEYLNTRTQLQSLIEQEQSAQSESEYLEFLYNELKEANFQPNEIEDLEEKVKAAQHQEDIIRAISTASYLLQDAEEAQLTIVKRIISELSSVSSYSSQAETLVSRLESVYEELKDIGFELTELQSSQGFEPQELQVWIERLDLGFKLLRKHNCADTAALLEYQESLANKISGLSSLSVDIERLRKQVSEQEDKLNAFALQIHRHRASVIPQIVEQLESTLARIGMPNARLRIELSESEEFNLFGKDDVSFLIDANKSGKFQPVAKVASGGELNRLLLSIKSTVAKNLAMPTMIFDEVDAAISGEAARQVSLLMQQISKSQQVIVLTHQAQMAAKGRQHVYIYKEEDKDSNQLKTRMRNLNEEERIVHIAQMIGGANPGEAAIKSAEELLSAQLQ